MNKGNFKQGHTPFNKGKKLSDYAPADSIDKIKQTQFKVGQKAGNKNNTWKGGIQTMTKDVVYLYDGTNKRVRRQKKVYEEIYGQIPKGWILFHIDGVMHNDSIDNLIAIPRAVLMKINANRLNRNYYEIKKEVEHYIKTNIMEREQVIKLKDGRTIFKTHNGFKSFVETKKGEVSEVTAEYYNSVKKNKA